MARGGAVAAVTVAVLAATWLLIFVLRRWLLAHAILDRPVARSSHRVPVPRGAGLALVPVLVAGALALSAAGGAVPGTPLAMAAASGLAVVSWRDDLRGLPVSLRLAAQALAVAIGLITLPVGPVFQGLLPPFLDRAAAGVLWLWFVNLYNFMDGIDGIAAGETVSLGVGIALVLVRADDAGDGTAAVALLVAAAGLGFLPWNWHPARIFLGDVGSVPLGYILGWLLLVLAGQGWWAPAVILPFYYLADASITLVRRIGQRERFWQAHREHFYQRAVGRDGNHAVVVRMILAANAVLIVLALLAVTTPGAAVALAGGTVAALLALLQRRAQHGG